MSGVTRKRKARSVSNNRTGRAALRRRLQQNHSSLAMAQASELLPSLGVAVVDLTHELQTDNDVVDLTSTNDSIVVVDGDTTLCLDANLSSLLLSSSDEAAYGDEEDVQEVMSERVSKQRSKNQKHRHGASVLVEGENSKRSSFEMLGQRLTCPVCMDSVDQVLKRGRLVCSTVCGHIFCSVCIRDSLSATGCCPTCRKKLRKSQFHPIYL
uniref:E3 ubiquitin-protein ligase RNF4-like isoform X2 n=1 Tax=Myxine glutinosa TaxID=7769 RepID=UPI00358FD31F